MKRILSLGLLSFGLMVLVACPDFNQSREITILDTPSTVAPYLVSSRGASQSTERTSASIYFVLTNPTDEEYEVEVKVTATWTYQGPQDWTSTGSAIEKFRIAGGASKEHFIFVRNSLTGTEMMKSFRATLETILATPVVDLPPPSVDWNNLPAKAVDFYTVLVEYGYDVNDNYADVDYLSEVYDAYSFRNMPRSSLLAYFMIEREIKLGHEEYRVFYFAFNLSFDIFNILFRDNAAMANFQITRPSGSSHVVVLTPLPSGM